MPDVNLLDNRPLARAAIWFLVDAAIVLAVLCGIMLHPDVIPNFFNHPGLLRAGLIAMSLLFALLAGTSSVLGFLSNCRPGKTVGTLAAVAMIAGLALIATLHWMN